MLEEKEAERAQIEEEEAERARLEAEEAERARIEAEELEKQRGPDIMSNGEVQLVPSLAVPGTHLSHSPCNLLGKNMTLRFLI